MGEALEDIPTMAGSIFVAAAPPTTWPLDMAGLEGQLRARWPEVHTAARHSSATEVDYLAFEADLAGERRHGAYFEHMYLLLEDGTPEFWAETISWFLALLPDDAEVVCMTEAVPEPVPMPRHADPDQIVSVLESLRA
jgi:hypothetical protein